MKPNRKMPLLKSKARKGLQRAKSNRLEMMLRKSKDYLRNPDDKEQSKLFIKKAREIEADEGHSSADDIIGEMAKKPPEQRKKKD
jgi:hypothetical protein